MSCIFCKIVNGEIPSKIVYQDEAVVAFQDSNPQAPTHLLIVPKRHIPTINDLNAEDIPLLAQLHKVGQKLAKEAGVSESGYRLVLNCNAEGGQSVYHIHLHLLGGRAMQWPPG